MSLAFKHTVTLIHPAVWCLLGLVLVPLAASSDINIRMQTNLGGMDVVLRDDVAPLTVGNFLDYMNSGAYDGMFIHRNITGFVSQTGGYTYIPENGPFFSGGATPIPVIEENLPLLNEAVLPGALSNVRGTLAMAKIAEFDGLGNPIPGGGPDSASNEWFFNAADNSLNLDNQNGGFTVFAEVLGDSMDVVDLINTQDVCSDIIGLGSLCASTSFGDTIIVGASQINFFDLDRLVLINNLGLDGDADGIIDRIEDGAPNNGDANDDGMNDSLQSSFTSFAAASGEYVSLGVPDGIALQSTDVLGFVWSLTTFNGAAPPAELAGLGFEQGYAGFDITGGGAGGAVTVAFTLPAGEQADTYYNFGATPDDATPHWYEFVFDGSTGAEFNGNVVSLHFVDGARGDSDLDDTNGFIRTVGGPATDQDLDNDGILNDVEDAAPNDGDGNSDDISDRTQAYVASFKDSEGGDVTLVVDPSLQLTGIAVFPRSFAPDNGFPAEPADLAFAGGFLGYEVTQLIPGSAATVTLILPVAAAPATFYIYGPTADDATDHWYEFLFDGTTGAEISDNVITLHFVDGARGDSDLDGTNGSLMVLGGAALDLDSDDDGIPDLVEDGAPNNGDGNDDGTPDREQENVVSLTDIRGNYIT
ncbi:MAG: peptidylprolyl isomerase, partial [Gammaproteobacteria bacterium]